MKGKTWVKTYFGILGLFFISAYFFIIVAEDSYPLRITDSISFDEKLRFLKRTNRLSESDAVVVGSSMGLINLDGEVLENRSDEIHTVVNLSSWGMQTLQLEQVLQLIEGQNKIKYVIYPTQALDYSADKRFPYDADDFAEIKKYINNEFTLFLYNRVFLNAFNFLKAFYNFKSYHQVEDTYPSLLFDRTGGIVYKIYGDNIDQERWNDNRVFGLNKKNFAALSRISAQLKTKNIKFIVVTTSLRLPILAASPEFLNQYRKYELKMKQRAEEDGFHYLNLHEELALSDDYFADNSHMNAEGAALVAQKVAEYIAEL